MKRIIFIGILVSVFAFSGTAYAGVGALDLCIGEPDVAVSCSNDDGNGCVYDLLTGVPAKKLNPNHWIVQSITTPPPGLPVVEAAMIGWFTSDHDKGGQGGFMPTLDQTFGCNCSDIIEIMEAEVYDPGDLDGQRKHGCTKSLIEDFLYYSADCTEDCDIRFEEDQLACLQAMDICHDDCEIPVNECMDGCGGDPDCIDACIFDPSHDLCHDLCFVDFDNCNEVADTIYQICLSSCDAT